MHQSSVLPAVGACCVVRVPSKNVALYDAGLEWLPLGYYDLNVAACGRTPKAMAFQAIVFQYGEVEALTGKLPCAKLTS